MELVALDKQDRIGMLTLNRPEKLNAMNPALLDEFSEASAEDRTLAQSARAAQAGDCYGPRLLLGRGESAPRLLRCDFYGRYRPARLSVAVGRGRLCECNVELAGWTAPDQIHGVFARQPAQRQRG